MLSVLLHNPSTADAILCEHREHWDLKDLKFSLTMYLFEYS